MTNKKSESPSNSPKVQSNSSRKPYTGAALAEFMAGYPHYAILAMNPAWQTDTDEDRWYFVLPVEGQPVIVRTGLSGFVPKGDLRHMAMTLIKDQERLLNSIADSYPMIADTRHSQLIALEFPVTPDMAS